MLLASRVLSTVVRSCSVDAGRRFRTLSGRTGRDASNPRIQEDRQDMCRVDQKYTFNLDVVTPGAKITSGILRTFSDRGSSEEGPTP
jgi:hypothetical protein